MTDTNNAEVEAFMFGLGFNWIADEAVFAKYIGDITDTTLSMHDAAFWYSTVRERERAALAEALSLPEIQPLPNLNGAATIGYGNKRIAAAHTAIHKLLNKRAPTWDEIKEQFKKEAE